MTLLDVRKLIWGWLTNRAMSTYLLIGVTLILVAGSALPNPAYMTPGAVAELQANKPLLFSVATEYNSQMLANSYLFGAICIFLIVSSACCSIDRFLERLNGTDSLSVPPGGSFSQPLLLMNADTDEVKRFVLGWLHNNTPGADIKEFPDAGLITAKRGRYGFYGSILFHLVLITVLVGMAISFLGGTRARFSITEGQRLKLERSSLRYLDKEPVWGLALPAAELELLSQQTIYDLKYQETAIEHRARFQVTNLQNGVKSVHDVQINGPMNIGGFNLLLMNGGFSPRFIITAEGAAIFDSFVALSEDGGKKDDFYVTSRQLKVEVKLIPALAHDSYKSKGTTAQLANPAVEVTVLRENGVIFTGIIQLGEVAQFAGYTLAVPEVRRWVDMEIAREPGMGFFFMVSFFGAIGLLIRIFDPDDDFFVRIERVGGQTMVEFAAQSRNFPALQAEKSFALARDLEALEKTSEKGVL